MAAPIPILNIYYLLCYAWNVLPPSGLVGIDAAGNDAPLDLLARVLVNGTHHLMRRGVEQTYQLHTEEISGIRGRCLFSQSARRMLIMQGKAICEFDELTSNKLPNQILKTTLYRMSRLWELDPKLRKECGKLVLSFRGVDNIKLTSQIFHRVRIHGNNRYYRFLNHICELTYHECLLDEKTGKYRFQDFFRDEGSMPRLFEKFLFNFYKKKQTEYQVSSERIHWDVESSSDPNLDLLPTMLTDISLRSNERTLIIDAKYYSKTLREYKGKTRINSNNLYQIYAYLKNIERNNVIDNIASGMLLYPVINEEISHTYKIDNHDIRIETVDLAQYWPDIETKLLSIIT